MITGFEMLLKIPNEARIAYRKKVLFSFSNVVYHLFLSPIFPPVNIPNMEMLPSLSNISMYLMT